MYEEKQLAKTSRRRRQRWTLRETVFGIPRRQFCIALAFSIALLVGAISSIYFGVRVGIAAEGTGGPVLVPVTTLLPTPTPTPTVRYGSQGKILLCTGFGIC